MNRSINTSACLAGFTAALHLFGGTPEIQGPLLVSAMPMEISLLLYACWHLVSIVLIGSAVVLFAAALSNEPPGWQPAVRFVAIMWLSFGAVFIAVALVFSGPPMLLKLPQWVLLLPVGALALKGSFDEK